MITVNELILAGLVLYVIGAAVFLVYTFVTQVGRSNRFDYLIWLNIAPFWLMFVLCYAFILWCDAGRRAEGKEPYL